MEIQLVVERRVDRLCRTDNEQRVAVRRCAHDRLGADVSASARPVVDDKLLAETLRQPLTDQARRDVTCAARGKADNDAHRPRRIGLRPRDARGRRERGSARGQMQKLSAGKFQCRQSRGTQQLKSQLLMQSSRQLGYELMPFWL